jgi:hypothetical protein
MRYKEGGGCPGYQYVQFLEKTGGLARHCLTTFNATVAVAPFFAIY